MLNVTEIQQLTPDSFFLAAHKSIAVPELIIFFIIISLISLFTGLIFAKSKEKYILIWVCSTVFGSAVLAAFIWLSKFTQNFINLF